jgi:hypothetical protein
MVSSARSVANAWHQASGKIKESVERAMRPLHGLAHFTGIGAGIGAIGGTIALEEVARRGWEVHAEREQSRVLLDTVLKNRGLGGQAQAFNDMLLRFTSDEAKVDYTTAFESTQMMLNSGKFKGVDDIHKFLGQMADVGGTAAQSKLGLMSIGKMFSEGRIEGKHLQQLAADLPQVNWYGQIAALRHESIGDLRKDMSKKGSTIDSDIIRQVLNVVTGEGGYLHGHSAAQMAGPAGEQARAAARWQTVLDSIGNIEDKAITPLFTKLLGDIDVVQLSHALDSAAKSAEQLGNDVSKAYGILKDTGALTKTSNLMGDIATKFGAIFGVKGGNTVDTITDSWKKMNEVLGFVKDHQDAITTAGKVFFEIWAVSKFAKVGRGHRRGF